MEGNNWTFYDDTNTKLPYKQVSSIAIDSSGNKWIGTNGGGLAKFDGKKWKVFNTSNSSNS